MESRQFYQYTIKENGDIFNTKTKKAIKKHLHKGVYEVRLTIDGKKKVYSFHRLYYFLFVKEFDMNNTNLCVSIKDGNVENISKNNLVLKSRKDIVQGENTKASKLTDQQVEEIRSLYKGKISVNQFDKSGDGFSYQDLANRYGVSKASIGRIIRGETRNKSRYKLK